MTPIRTQSFAPASPTEETIPREEEVPVVATETTKPVATEEDEPIATEPISAPETDTIIPENVDHKQAEDIVARVFAAPVTTSTDKPSTTTAILENAAKNSTRPDTTTSPSSPTTSSEPAPKPSTSTDPTTSTNPTSTDSTVDRTLSSTPSKPVSERIAPPAIASEPITKADLSPQNKEGGKKLTSWLKSKLHRGSKQPHEEAAKNAVESPAAKLSTSGPGEEKNVEASSAGKSEEAVEHTSAADTSAAESSTAAPTTRDNTAGAAKESTVSPIDAASTTVIPPMSRSRSPSVSSLSSEEEDGARGRKGRPNLESWITASDVRVNEGANEGTNESVKVGEGKEDEAPLSLPPKGSFERNAGGRDSPVGSKFVEDL
jgi:hypothetical protein